MRPTIVSTAAVLLTLLGLAAGDTLTRPADAQVYPYPYYGCPPGYYYDGVYGCLPAGYYYGPPSYVYPGPSFEFFYGGRWDHWHGGGHPAPHGAPHGGGGHRR